jgi:hypothetical protein
MRRFLSVLLAILLACCFFSSGVHAQVTIVGPDKADVAEVVMLKISGVTLEDLTSTPPRFGMVAVPSPSMVAGVYDFLAGTPSVVFQARTPGSYYLVVATTVGGPLRVLVHEIKVGGGNPDPNPNPGPDPNPNPPAPGKRLVFILCETHGQTPQHAALWIALHQSEDLKKHRLVILDQDGKDEAGRVPAGFAPYIAVAKEVQEGKASMGAMLVPLPVLVVADMQGAIPWKGPCPGTAPEVIAIVKKAGG